MSISDMKNDNFVSAIDVKTTAESGECFLREAVPVYEFSETVYGRCENL